VLHNSDNLLFNDTVVIQGIPTQNITGLSFTIYDDDAIQMGSRPPRMMPYSLSGGTLISTAFADTYVRPEAVSPSYIDNDVPFNRNMDGGLGYYTDWLPTVNYGRDLIESADFWYAYVLAAFQPEVSADDDPDSPGSTTLGLTDPGILPENRSAIYVEPLREFEVLPLTPRIHEEHILVHEIGHQGGGSHADGGIMANGAPIDQDKFTPISIAKFRNNTTY
jgi:hypothetical protein